jgi:menaquinol-cytochrome c reductase iron-sulfur subunit
MNDDFLHPQRRSFMTWMAAAVGAAAASIVAIPGVAYLLDPLLRRSRHKASWYVVADAKVLEATTPVAVAVKGEQVDAWTRSPMQRLGTVWLQRDKQGKVKALSAECPHLGCQIQYRSDSNQFTCPCHESAFALDGTALSGPSPRALDALETQVENGKVKVRFVRFRLQVAEKIEISS